MSFWDKVIVACTGGVRIRIANVNGRVEASHCGRLPGLPPERLSNLVRELAPDGIGTVHINRDAGRWTIKIHGRGFEDGFEQRLRNTLVNS